MRDSYNQIILAVLCALVPAYAQGTFGALTGTLKDPTGAHVVEAAVKATNESTGIAVNGLVRADGTYLISQLVPGTYSVSASATGFKILTLRGIKIDVGGTVTQDLVLEIGTVSEAVNVEAQTNLVETTSARVGTTVQVSHVLEMPLSDRNVFTLVNLVPGSFVRGGDVSIGGGRTSSALALLDGVNNTRGGLGITNVEMSPPVDSMQEFKVEVSNLSAEYGRTSAGLVNAVTKSGTNSLHGSVYEFLRNDALDAGGWNNDAKPPLRRNNFGASIGGPVVKNRTFFFYNYDGLRSGNGVSTTRSVGLPEWRNGDFSTAMRDAGGVARQVPLYDPETGSGTFGSPRDTLPFPGNVIPTSRIDPVASKVVQFLPGPNRSPDNPLNQSNNWQENRVNRQTRDYHTARVDHQFSESLTLFGRYILTQPEKQRDAYSQGYGASDPDGLSIDNRRQNLALNATKVFSPTFLLNVTAGVNRVFIYRTTGNCCETNYSTEFGIPNVPGEAFPRFNFGGGLAPVNPVGAVGNANRRASFTNFDYTGRFTRIAGQHTLQFGVQYSTFNGNEVSRPQPSGVWAFNGNYTRGINASGQAVANTGLPFADFLLGRVNAVDARVAPGIGKRLRYYAAYLQDDWKITSNLTLNLGLRYETESPAYEVAGRMSNFDPWVASPLAGTGDIPAGALGALQFPNRNGNGKYLWKWDKNNFAPRLGFAWRPFGTNNTSVRGGYGVYFGNPYDTQIVQEARVGYDFIYRANNPVPFRLRDGVPAGALDAIPESELTPAFGSRGTRFATSTMQFLAQDRATPYSQNLNITIQHQIKSILFEIGYLGNLSRKIVAPNINLNQIPGPLLSRTDIPERLRRPWTVLASDQSVVQLLAPNWGVSNYHALTLKSERRFNRGFSWVASYTFGKWMDNIGFNGAGPFGDNDAPQNIYDRRSEKAPSTNDLRHRLVVAPIIDLPFGRGRKWINRGGVLNALVGGWQLATIGTFRSGAPFGVTVLNGPRDILGDQTEGRVLRPNLVGNPVLHDELRGSPATGIRGIQWLNPAAFQTPDRYTFGNAARTLPGVRGPGYVSFDAMLAKNFTIGERWRAQFRWEAFNALNSPEFANPNDQLGGGGFGIVTSAGGRRIMQLGLKLYW